MPTARTELMSMPKRMKVRCAVRGCPRTTYERFCEEHAGLAGRLYDRRRAKPVERGYDAAWRRLAKIRRYWDGGGCQRCRAAGRLTLSVLVDHIMPIHVRPDWRLEFGNTQVLCVPCHGRKTGEDLRCYGGRVQKNLTAAQQANRAQAQSLEHPPRSDETGLPPGDRFCGARRKANPMVASRALFREIG
jgi:5-methylcytosine-specific restriction enzyme A